MKKLILLSIYSLLLLSSCDEEFLDPSRPSQEDVFSSRLGVIGAANGLQARYCVGRQSMGYTIASATGFTTGELGIPSAGNADEAALQTGGSVVLPNNGIIGNLWAQCLVLNSESQKILNSINALTVPTEKASVLAHTCIYKALALSTLIQYFEKVPITNGKNVTFNTRAEVLAECIRTLKQAEPTINDANGFALLSGNVKYKNTLYALLARYYNMLGDNTNALAYANLVDLTVKSNFIYDAVAPNPIAQTAFLVTNNYQPIGKGLGLPASIPVAATDGRINFYINPTSTPTNVKGAGFWDALTKAVPVYLPGEMTLIKAEVYARTSQFPLAVIEINKILQKTIATDAWGVAANQPAYTGTVDQPSLLTEIYRNRCIELFMSGLKLEDTRRFGRAAAGTAGAERNRNWYPYPEAERFNNPNTPADPAN